MSSRSQLQAIDRRAGRPTALLHFTHLADMLNKVKKDETPNQAGAVNVEPQFKEYFLTRWKKYFPGAALPLIFFYTDNPDGVEIMPEPRGWRCFISELTRVRRGRSIALGTSALPCRGAKRYLGFNLEVFPKFDYFLSCGLEGEIEGERYKKSPELVRRLMYDFKDLPAPTRYIVFKRWDELAGGDEPEGVLFFAHADILSGLFTLANFDRPDAEGVYAPFSSGCGSIVRLVRLEAEREHPRAVLGMFDVSARMSVSGNLLSFGVPFGRFRQLVENMDESFLITDSWDKVRKRIAREAAEKG